MTTNYAAIQIIGTQRSGSNLLRVILDQSEEIASPHPPHIFTSFSPLLPIYGRLTASSYKQLVSDVVDYVHANPVPWDGVELNKEDIYRASDQFSLPELNRLVYEEAAKSKGARYWCCKSMANVHFADELETAVPDVKYVFLYRDGRDVAASFKKAVVGEKHSYHLAKQWSHDQEACLRLEKRTSAARFYKLSYETLIADPENTVRSLCRFLDIKYVDSMLSFYESKTSRLTAEAGEMWSNLQKPIMKDNTGKYRSAFSENDLEIFETVAGNVLQDLGYDLHSQVTAANRARYTELLLSQERILGYTVQNQELKKDTLVKARPSDLENRLPQELIIQQIKSRTLETHSVCI